MTGRPVARGMLESWGRRRYQKESLLLLPASRRSGRAEARDRRDGEQDGKGESTRDDASYLATGHRKAYCIGRIHVKDVGI